MAKRISNALLFVAVLAMAGVAIIAAQYHPAKGGSLAPVRQFYMTGVNVGPGEISATTTRVFQALATASSTIIVPLEGADEIDLTLRAIASTSASTLGITEYVSDNYVSSTGNGDWYPVDMATTTATSYIPTLITIVEPQFLWSLSTSTKPICFTNEVCKHIVIKNPGYGRYLKFGFGLTGSNASLWGYAVPRNIVPN